MFSLLNLKEGADPSSQYIVVLGMLAELEEVCWALCKGNYLTRTAKIFP